MSYRRVIPRDLFNEASLLKCYGRLYILLETVNGPARFSADDVSRFEVEQREEDGAIYVANLSLLVGAREYYLTRPLNSRAPWPLYAELADGTADPVAVFDDVGDLSTEMKELITSN